MLKDEENFGIKKFKTYEDFGKKFIKLENNVIKNIKKLKKIIKNNRLWSSSKSNYSFKFFWNFKRNRFYS